MSSLKAAVAGQILRESIDLGARLTEIALAVAAASTTTLDTRLGNFWEISMGTNISTLTISNVPAAGKVYALILKIKQDNTGSRSITWPAAVKWPANVPPVLTSTANKYDIIVLWTTDGGTTWSGSVSSQNY